ncbi:MAG: sigma-70 family RNA polymerase sigma factor [Caldilineaceae bacterium SB0661_bin_32]|uniref:Sigma-70 family RNA polymerase sigma factor n=1 Tax=Caldilineaceae bacterium SB0661_bin_32 TaxID=2605255 RepID=A0A6B1DC06_9CHLR|nr:sigma-70 family RNA polymerase sigma factor [Caldilineaceae bacterium SB0661_bin_32]
MTDGELVRRAQQGERQAFDELILRHQPIALSLAIRIVGDRERGLELTQEAVLHAYLSLDRLRKPDSFRAWLCGIVVNLCKNHLRRPRVETLSLELLSGGRSFDSLPFPDSAPQPHEAAEARETHRLILAAVEQLSPANRDAVLLYYFKQLNLREIAALLQISVPAVKGRLHKSRRKLRDQLLPNFAELQSKPAVAQQTRSQKMIPVTVLDIVVPDPEKDSRILILADESRRRLLAIWIGPFEADDIALSLREIKLHRPMTFSFMADMLGKASVQIESVAVSALENDTFFATVHALNGDGKVAVDARPSDAIALAMRTQSPIFVAAEVMEAVGLEIPADMEVSAQGKRPKMSELFPIDPEEKESRLKERERWESMSPEERREESRKKLLAHLTESGTLSQSGESGDE